MDGVFLLLQIYRSYGAYRALIIGIAQQISYFTWLNIALYYLQPGIKLSLLKSPGPYREAQRLQLVINLIH